MSFEDFRVFCGRRKKYSLSPNPPSKKFFFFLQSIMYAHEISFSCLNLQTSKKYIQNGGLQKSLAFDFAEKLKQEFISLFLFFFSKKSKMADFGIVFFNFTEIIPQKNICCFIYFFYFQLSILPQRDRRREGEENRPHPPIQL